MKLITERLQEIVNETGLDKKSFSEKVGINPGTLSHIFTGRNNPSLEVILQISNIYDQYSLEWLLKGEGEKYKNDKNKKLDTSQLKNEELQYKLKLVKMLVAEHFKTEISLLDEIMKEIKS
jgi:transcriptional regulator with XRE-family HTH domain